MPASRRSNLATIRKQLAPLRAAAVDAVRAGQAIVETGMVARCPAGPTRKLRQSIRSTAVRTGKTSVGGGVIAGTDHAGFVEYGTINMAPQPFVRSTAMVDGPKAEAAMARVMEGASRG